MHAVTIIFLVATASLLNLVDAHGFHHPGTRDEDPSFDNLVEQKYPTLADLDPNFVANHRRKLAEDLTYDSKSGESLVCGNCYKNNNKWYTCDELVLSGYTCSHLETKICKDGCNNCICSCENTCKDGRSCDQWISSNPKLTCAELNATAYGCNCRGCSKCGDGCTQKCSMLNKNIKGSHDCGTWYRMDPKYTTKFLKANAVVTGTVNPCTCDGCNGNKAVDFCPNDIPNKNSNYMDIETAKAKGKIGKMRLAINDDMVDPDKCKNNAFCRKHTCLEGDIGKKINNCVFERGSNPRYLNSKTNAGCITTCKKEDILTAEKSFMVRRRFAWLKTFMGDVLSLKPTQDDIKLKTAKVHFIEGLMKDPQTKKFQDYPDSDLVVVVTMRPSFNPSVAGYAIAYQRDTERRATVGLFNWVPHTVDETLYKIEKEEEKLSNKDKAELLYAKAGDYRLMVHEVLHLTGAIQSDPYYFINKVGESPCSHQIYIDEVEEWSGHRVRKIRTPKLLARAREQFACSSLTGVPMEDHHIGYNAHWESRVFGSEIMSYGDNSGESYLSDLTLAFLDDTGYYVVNYTVGGRLTPHTAEKFELANVPTLLQKDTDELKKKAGKVGNTSINERTPGYTRWGRHAGCEFVTGSPKNWPAAYRCDSPQSGGCTPDNKMTARCTLETWGQTAIAASTIRCEPPANSAWGGAKTSRSKWNCIKNNAGGGIPEEYRHLGPTGLAGYNDAMDYVPHFVGFWNCQDLRPKKLSPLDVASEAGSLQNTSASWDDLFGSLASDSNSIGGQTRCENCRCFKSSLVPLRSFAKISPSFPIYGLCYVSNCYNEEYLQVGIDGARGLYWYGCPPEGGKMYIPLFTGSLNCPVAKEFCSVEPVSGVIYTETDANLEWIAYGVVGGIALILSILLCVFWKKIDHKVHFCCGIDQDHKDWDMIMENRHGKHSASGYCLTVIGAIWAIAGAALALFGLYSFFLPFVEEVKPLWDTQTRQAPSMITVGTFTVFVSICAIEGAWKNQPTITLVTYFYVCVCTSVLCAVVPVLPFILSEPLELILESQWVRYKNNFPDTWHGFNSTEAIDHVVKVALPEYALYFAIAAIVFIVSVIGGIVCSILQLTLHVVVRNFEVVMNSVFFVLGSYLVYFAVQNFHILDVYIYVSAIIPAGFLVLAGVIGVLAACQKHETCFKCWAVLAAVGLVVTLVTASILVWVSLIPVKDAVSGRSPSICVLPDKSSVVCKEPTPMCCSCVLAVDQVDIQLATSTGASATTTKGAVAEKTFTRCEHSCFDVPGYACTKVGDIITTTTTAAPGDKPLLSYLMQIDPYIRSLDDDKISEISTSMSESLEIVDFNIEQLVAWITAYVRIYAVALYVCCLVICGLFATNRLIIHWNHQNDHPHGEHPYYLMFAVSVKKQNLRQKMHAAGMLRSLNRNRFKGINRRTPLLKSISMAAIQTREILRPKKNIAPVIEHEIFRDPKVGLGMSMVGSTYGPNDEYHCLTVNAFRYRPDGSPGPAEEVGVQIGDRVLAANGHPITDFPSLQHAVGNANSVTIQFGRDATLASIGEESGPANYDEHYPEIVMLHVRRTSPATKMSAKLAEVHEHGHSSYYDDDETSHVVVQDVWDGPLYQGGLLVNDVVLTIDDYNVETLQQVASLVQGKTEMDFVVKRMSQSQGENSRRENKVHIFNITISAELGLGLNLKEIKSGLGDSSSNTFLYVKELREYSDFAPGPGLIAGVRQYDLVLKINDMTVHTIDDAKRAIEGQKTAQCEVRRMIRHFSAGHPYHPAQHAEAKEVDLVVTRAVGESLGLSLSESYGTDSDDPFLYVTKVRDGSPGERAGIRVQDIFWRVQGQDVYNLDDLKQMITSLEKFELTVRRQ